MKAKKEDLMSKIVISTTWGEKKKEEEPMTQEMLDKKEWDFNVAIQENLKKAQDVFEKLHPQGLTNIEITDLLDSETEVEVDTGPPRVIQ